MVRIHLVLNLDEEQSGKELAQLLTKGMIQTAVVEVCKESTETPRKLYCLTSTERRVLEALSQHDTIEEAAQALCLSYGTVRKHLEHIYFKLDVHSLHRAIAVALRCGLIR